VIPASIQYTFALGSADESLLARLVGDSIVLGAGNGSFEADHFAVHGLALKTFGKSASEAIELTTNWRTTDIAQNLGIDNHEFRVLATANPLGFSQKENGWDFPITAFLSNDPVDAVEIYESVFEEELADGSARGSFTYDKHICIRFRSGKSVSLTTRHESILGAIEIRRETPPEYCTRTDEKVQLRRSIVKGHMSEGRNV
jgi:hypothetical protein